MSLGINYREKWCIVDLVKLPATVSRLVISSSSPIEELHDKTHSNHFKYEAVYVVLQPTIIHLVCIQRL
jgi:hypothetical protein